VVGEAHPDAVVERGRRAHWTGRRAADVGIERSRLVDGVGARAPTVNPAAQSFDRRTQRQRARALLDRIVVDLLHDAGVGDRVPVELRTLARHLGCAEIRSRSLGMHHARTEVSRDGIVITLNVDRSLTRQRFALAHEIGHLVLAHPRYEFLAAVRRDAGLTDMERFCNDFAGRVLLPEPWLNGLERHPVAIAGLCEHASAAQVSLAAALLRLRETRGWSYSMLQWRRSYGRWEIASRVAVPRSLMPHIVTGAVLQEQLDVLASRDTGPHLASLTLGRTRGLEHARVQALRRGATMLVLADLRGAKCAALGTQLQTGAASSS